LSEILSYYRREENGKIIQETLAEHIDEMLKILKNFSESKINRYLQKTFPMLKNFSEIVKLAVVFHDVGKVFYQKDPKNITKNLSFMGHEFLSSLIFNEFQKNSENLIDSHENFGVDAASLIKFSILFHHHAMCIRDRKKFTTLIDLNIEGGLKLFPSLIKCLIKFLGKGDVEALKNALKYDVESKDIIANLQRCSDEDLRTVWREVWVSGFKRKIALSLLDILITTDNLAANKKRGPNTTIFHEALRQFSEFYL